LDEEELPCLGGDLVHGGDELVEVATVGDLLGVAVGLFWGESGGDGLAGDLVYVWASAVCPRQSTRSSKTKKVTNRRLE